MFEQIMSLVRVLCRHHKQAPSSSKIGGSIEAPGGASTAPTRLRPQQQKAAPHKIDVVEPELSSASTLSPRAQAAAAARDQLETKQSRVIAARTSGSPARTPRGGGALSSSKVVPAKTTPREEGENNSKKKSSRNSSESKRRSSAPGNMSANGASYADAAAAAAASPRPRAQAALLLFVSATSLNLCVDVLQMLKRKRNARRAKRVRNDPLACVIPHK